MSPIVFCLLAILRFSTQDALDAAQFQRLMVALHEPIQDVTFVYEGGMDKRGFEELRTRYQGVYSFRYDGATLLDVFNYEASTDKSAIRNVSILLNGSMTAVSQIRDIGNIVTPQKSRGYPGVLNSSGSAERLLYFWRFRTLQDMETYGYNFLGWESVEGRRCAKVQLFEVPERAISKINDKPIMRFWIDLERGGHPLKVEFYSGDQLRMRTDAIKLKQLPLPSGESVWFPVHAETGSFSYADGQKTIRSASEPLYVETYDVVNGSVVFNQNLKDDYFRLDLDRDLPRVGRLADFQQDVRYVKPVRTDPAGVKMRLDEQLAEADRQAAMLEASAPEREVWTPTLLIQTALIAAGAATIGLAIFWKWKMG